MPGTLDRRELVRAVLRDRGDMVVVAGLGAPAWDITAAGDTRAEPAALGRHGRGGDARARAGAGAAGTDGAGHHRGRRDADGVGQPGDDRGGCGRPTWRSWCRTTSATARPGCRRPIPGTGSICVAMAPAPGSQRTMRVIGGGRGRGAARRRSMPGRGRCSRWRRWRRITAAGAAAARGGVLQARLREACSGRRRMDKGLVIVDRRQPRDRRGGVPAAGAGRVCGGGQLREPGRAGRGAWCAGSPRRAARAAAFRGRRFEEADVERLFAAAQDRFGRLAGLVNNAGVAGRGVAGGGAAARNAGADACRQRDRHDPAVAGGGADHVDAAWRRRRRDRQPVLGRGAAGGTRRDRALRGEQGGDRQLSPRGLAARWPKRASA